MFEISMGFKFWWPQVDLNAETHKHNMHLWWIVPYGANFPVPYNVQALPHGAVVR